MLVASDAATFLGRSKRAARRASLPLEGGATVDGLEIKSYGQAPWQVATAALEVTLRNDHVAHLTVLDMNGMPLRTVPLARADGALRFAFPAEAMYVVLH